MESRGGGLCAALQSLGLSPHLDARSPSPTVLRSIPMFCVLPPGLSQRYKDIEGEVFNALLTLITDTQVGGC